MPRYGFSEGPITTDLAADAVAHALSLVGDPLLLSTATPDQLTIAAAILARARARLPDRARATRKFEAIARLEGAGKRIGEELRRRAFVQDSAAS